MLVTVRNYVAEFISLLLTSALLLTIDPVALLIIVFVCIVGIPISKYGSKLMYERREKQTTMQGFVIYLSMLVK